MIAISVLSVDYNSKCTENNMREINKKLRITLEPQPERYRGGFRERENLIFTKSCIIELNKITRSNEK